MPNFDSLVLFMDSREISPERRDLKIECVKGFNQSNEDSWTVFPKCEDCNPDSRVITIPNKNPVLQHHIVTFPQPKEECLGNCNPDLDTSQTPKFLVWETEI